MNKALSADSEATEFEGSFMIAKQDAAERQILEQSKRIEFYLNEYTVEFLAQKMSTNDFEIPPYQREDTWEPNRKTRFIESLIIGLPIPFLFFWESQETGRLEIVDGSQRLRTIEQFLYGNLILGKMELLSKLEGFRFSDLPESRQRKIKNRSIRGIVLNENADESARFDLFDRINTGSLIANPAEVRRGALVGPFMDLVIELAKDDNFVGLAPVPEKQLKAREREELVTRFFAYGDGLSEYKDRPTVFLFNYSRMMNDVLLADPSKIVEYRSRFQATMSFIKELLPFGFRKKQNANTTPRARFEALAVGSHLALTSSPTLASKDIGDLSWISGSEFRQLTGSDSANAIKRLQGRIFFVRDHLLGDSGV